MKTTLVVLSIWFGLLLLVGLPPLMVEAIAPPWVGLSSVAIWDEVTLDVAGGPETIQGYLVALEDPAVDQNLVTVPPVPPIKTLSVGPLGWQGTPLVALFSGRPNGSYALQVQAIDMARNVSVWSEKLLIQYDGTGPAMPKNVKLKLSLTVTSP